MERATAWLVTSKSHYRLFPPTDVIDHSSLDVVHAIRWARLVELIGLTGESLAFQFISDRIDHRREIFATR
jgi:hypothetical protein